MRMLETKRLILKPVEETDLGALLELQWDKDLMQYMNFKPLSFEQQKQWFQSLGKTTLAFSVFLKQKDKNELIGLGTINHIDQFHQRATWGLKLKSNIQSKGIGFESSLILLHFGFSNLNLQKIHGDQLFDNYATRRMCEKIGVREEGILINHIFQNGKFRNLVLVGILREEFYKKNLSELKKLGLIYKL